MKNLYRKLYIVAMLSVVIMSTSTSNLFCAADENLMDQRLRSISISSDSSTSTEVDIFWDTLPLRNESAVTPPLPSMQTKKQVLQDDYMIAEIHLIMPVIQMHMHRDIILSDEERAAIQRKQELDKFVSNCNKTCCICLFSAALGGFCIKKIFKIE